MTSKGIPLGLTAAADGATGDEPGSPALQRLEQRVTTRIELPTRTIVKVILTLASIWLLVQLSSVILDLVIALLLTAALDPVVTRLERRGLPRSASVALILLTLVGILAGIGLLFVPPLIDEGQQVVTNLPEYTGRIEDLLPGHPQLYERIRESAQRRAEDPGSVLAQALALSRNVFTWLSTALLVLTMTAYLLVDGERIYYWVSSYLPPRHRVKVRRALPAISQVVGSYLLGQVITSLLFGVFAYIVLKAFGVPQALLLALLAFIADAIPVIGATLATAPPVIIALTTVSTPAAGAILVLYVLYQQVENHLIVPRVYGRTMEISSFAVLLAVLVGGVLLGVTGALLALPIAAAIPAIQRVWSEEPDPGGQK